MAAILHAYSMLPRARYGVTRRVLAYTDGLMCVENTFFMDIRYSANPRDVKRFISQELRQEFLIENLYRPDEVTAVYSHVDRMVTLGGMPVRETVPIDKGIDVWAGFGTRCFLGLREIGIFNIGGARTVTVDETVLSPGLRGLPVYHHGGKGSAVRKWRRLQARQVLHGFRPRSPEL